ncbi:hypothetical protein L0F63_005781 [Massospora cicadina]|nr:hypothetical protein L0F63_005781 [Massospora cicadina]
MAQCCVSQGKSSPGESTPLVGQGLYDRSYGTTPRVSGASGGENLPTCPIPTQHRAGRSVVKGSPGNIKLFTLAIISTGFVGLLAPRCSLAPYSNIGIKSAHRPYERSPSLEVRGYHGGVAAEHETCSEVGKAMLKKEGSAVDAAISSALCVGVVNGFSSGKA